MKCFIFRHGSKELPKICGASPLEDLVFHLRCCEIDEIYTDSAAVCPGVTRAEYAGVKPLLGNDWIAAFESTITRQSPMLLRKRAMEAESNSAVSLACSGRPWRHTTVLTDSRGHVEAIEENPPPENARTNLCFSGLAWVGKPGFDPRRPVVPKGSSGFFLPDYWKKVCDNESVLKAFHDVLRGSVVPWPHFTVPTDGIALNGELPESTVLSGTFWLGNDCKTGEGCEFENCVIMDGASVGPGCSLRNCLVLPGVSVPGNTRRDDKYLTLLGE